MRSSDSQGVVCLESLSKNSKNRNKNNPSKLRFPSYDQVLPAKPEDGEEAVKIQLASWKMPLNAAYYIRGSTYKKAVLAHTAESRWRRSEEREHRWSGSTPMRGRYSEAVFLSMIRRPVSVQNLADDVESVTFVTWVNYVTDIYFRRRMRALGVPGYEQDQDDLPTLEPVRSLVVNALP